MVPKPCLAWRMPCNYKAAESVVGVTEPCARTDSYLELFV